MPRQAVERFSARNYASGALVSGAGGQRRNVRNSTPALSAPPPPAPTGVMPSLIAVFASFYVVSISQSAIPYTHGRTNGGGQRWAGRAKSRCAAQNRRRAVTVEVAGDLLPQVETTPRTRRNADQRYIANNSGQWSRLHQADLPEPVCRIAPDQLLRFPGSLERFR